MKRTKYKDLAPHLLTTVIEPLKKRFRLFTSSSQKRNPVSPEIEQPRKSLDPYVPRASLDTPAPPDDANFHTNMCILDVSPFKMNRQRSTSFKRDYDSIELDQNEIKRAMKVAKDAKRRQKEKLAKDAKASKPVVAKPNDKASTSKKTSEKPKKAEKKCEGSHNHTIEISEPSKNLVAMRPPPSQT